MIFSSRYVVIILLCFAIALIPTITNLYLRPEYSLNERIMSSIPRMVGPFIGIDSDLNTDARFREKYGTDDWIKRAYINSEDGIEFKLFAARSYDTRPLFYLPEKGIITTNWTEQTTRRDSVNTAYGEIPVHVLEIRGNDENRIAFYCLFYGNRVVDNPYLFYLSILPELLIGHRKPMTLIFIHTKTANYLDPPSYLIERAHALLRSAVESLLGVKKI